MTLRIFKDPKYQHDNSHVLLLSFKITKYQHIYSSIYFHDSVELRRFESMHYLDVREEKKRKKAL